MNTGQITEGEFIDRAHAFLTERVGDGRSFDADTDLVKSGVLDSLLMVEFFFFLEQVRGEAINTEGFSVQSIATLRSAYRFAMAS
jgi:hypothetical protein